MVENVVLKGVRVIDIDAHESKSYESKEPVPADCETAITATGFGLFNILVVLAALPIAWAGAFNMSTSAFILASSECDFELTFLRKGILNSSVYFGMIMSPFFWTFLMERMNRKAVIIMALLMDAMCNILSSIINSYSIFLLLKFITGTIVSGPYSQLIPYINEFQPVNYRSKFATWSGLFFGFGFIIPAVLAVIVTPRDWSIEIFNFVFPSWRIYLLICTVPSIIGIVTMSLLPESPKRMIEDGNISGAHDLLRQMYRMNNWKSIYTYPINKLQERVDFGETGGGAGFVPKISQSWSNLQVLFSKPHSGIFLLINFHQFGSMLAFNTMRLWVPQIYQIISNFDISTWNWSEGRPTTCDYLAIAIIPSGSNATIYSNPNCVQWKISPPVYVNSSIIATSAIGFSFLCGLFYTTRLRKRGIMYFCYVVGIICAFGTNWGQYVPWMLAQAAVVVVTGRTTANIVMAANNNIIPPSLRQTASIFVTNVGNFASIVGNLGFSWLLGIDCTSGFIAIAVLLSVCLVLSPFILQPEEKKKLDKEKSSFVMIIEKVLC